MLTKKQMLDLIVSFKSKTNLKYIRDYLDNLNEEDKKFLLKYRLRQNKNRDLDIHSNLEKFCYELSIDKIVDDRNKKIAEILSQL